MEYRIWKTDDKIWKMKKNDRVSKKDALALLREAPLLDVGERADKIRKKTILKVSSLAKIDNE